MERRKPLKRTALRPGKPLERKTPLKQGGELARVTPLRAKPKPRRSAAEMRASELWFIAVAKGKPCAKCGSKRSVQGHHILSQQFLRRLARKLGVTAAVLLWDVRIGLPLCERCHSRHHSRVETIPRSLIPDAALNFVNEYGAWARFDREYP